MKIGAHLPLIDFHGEGYALDTLLSFADAARELGYSSLTSNDHMVFSKPWLDGLTALAAVLPRTGSMTLMTSIALAVIRGPVQAAKTLA
ncbi:MAG TPA: LLM class flavin-dependent oxidoreductase, partial [Dehalococcoidia bacterium]|nr:LLM class flavin-dependent oxidoreductase [Dehalococcoidia bacterium]